MDALGRWIVRHPVAMVVANLAVTLVLGYYALQVRIESSLESVLPGHDPEIDYYNHVRATFGSDDVAVIGMRVDDLFSAATLQKIARITDAIAKVPGVEAVLSITNAPDPIANVLHPPRLIQQIPPSPAEAEELKQKLRERPLYGKNLVSDDFKGAAINVFLQNLTDVQYLDLDIDNRIKAVLAAEKGPERFFFTGAGHIKQAAVELMREDLFRFTPIALSVLLLVLWLSFWSIRGVVLPVVSVLCALVWTVGVLVLAGKAITLGTFILPPLVIVIGSSYGIHVMARYYEQVDRGVPHEGRALGAFRLVWVPLVVSALTMAIGFGSLMVSRISAIWDLGLFAAIGLVLLTVTSLTFIPAALQLMRPDRRGPRAQRIATVLSGALRRLGMRDARSRRGILWGAAGFALIALSGVRLIQVDADFLYYFAPTSEVRRSNEAINAEIVGSNPFYLVIEGSGSEVMKRWEVLKQIKDLQQFLHSLPGITSSLSLIDYLELFDAGLKKGDEGDLIVDEQGRLVPVETAKRFWDDPSRLPPVLSIISRSPETFKSVVTPDFRSAIILVRTNLSGSRRIEETLGKIRSYIARHFPAELTVRPTGNLVLLTGTTSDIVIGQIESLSIALAVIFAVMALMFLSTKVGFFAMLPNLLPILLFFGVMGWLGVLLNLGTSLIATIALGIAVDSTIHYMARLSIELKGETDQVAALVRTLQRVGMPIIFTTVALCLGFLVFAFSNFMPIKNFGILTAVTLVTALGANLILLPALLATTKIITLWDLLGVQLGADPGRTVPLLAGLRPSQARIVVLMGELKRFARGEPIVRRGESGDEMYVIIRGRTEVWAGSGTQRQQVAELHRGDVFGEMGLVRQEERTADVIAGDDVEVLALDRRFLERIQNRYPRIASKVFLNLTRVLSDSVQRITEQLVGARRA